VEAALTKGVVPLLLARLDWRASASTTAASGPFAAAGGGSVAQVQQPGGGGSGASAGSGDDRDEAVARVLAVDVLHLLAAEGAHAAQVGSHCWQPSLQSLLQSLLHFTCTVPRRGLG